MMITWGSFLLGGIVFGLLFFFLGGVIGLSAGKENKKIPVINITKDILKYVNKGETVHFSSCITRSDGDDGDDNYDGLVFSDLPEQNWRDN